MKGKNYDDWETVSVEPDSLRRRDHSPAAPQVNDLVFVRNQARPIRFPSHRNSCLSLEMDGFEAEISFRFLSSTPPRTTRGGNKVEMKRKNISALFPRQNVSKNSFEVLRLGLGRDPIRELPTGSMPPNCIGLSIGALPLECRKGRLGRRHGDNARHPKAAIRCWRCWRHMDRAQPSDADVLEDWL